jgi:hypothetical protein
MLHQTQKIIAKIWNLMRSQKPSFARRQTPQPLSSSARERTKAKEDDERCKHRPMPVPVEIEA